jgi:hypothetical protein
MLKPLFCTWKPKEKKIDSNFACETRCKTHEVSQMKLQKRKSKQVLQEKL